MIKIIGIIVTAILLSACSTAKLTKEGTLIKEIDAIASEKCNFIRDITESAYSGMVFASSGVDVAMKKVRNTAAEIGATHILWSNIAAGGAVQVVSAKAYKCRV